MKISQFKERLAVNADIKSKLTAPEEEIYSYMPFTDSSQLEEHILYIGSYVEILAQNTELSTNFLCTINDWQDIESLKYDIRYPHANFIFLLQGTSSTLQAVIHLTSKVFLAENRYTSQINRLVAVSNANRGLQYLIDEAYRINKSPIIVIDSSYRILAMYQDAPADDKLDLRAQRKLGYLTEHNLERMKRDRIYEQLRQSDTKLRYGKASDSDYFWVDTLVYIHGIEVAEIGVIEYDHPFTNYDFEFIHFLKQLVAWEMQKQNFSPLHHAQMHSIFLSELLSKRFMNAQTIELRKRMLGWKDSRYLYVFSIFSEEKENVNFKQKADIFCIQILHLIPDSYWTFKEDHFVFLIGKETDNAEEFQPNSPLAQRLAHNHMYGILSNCFSSLTDVKKHYELIFDIKEYKTYFAPNATISRYTDFYIYHIAKLISSTNHLSDFYHPLIVKIQAYDNENHTNYLETLAEYLTHIDNPSISAKNLCIHKNTFFYRMNKLKDLFPVDLKDGTERMKLLLTIEFMKLEL